MNGNTVFLRCMTCEDTPERVSAREYLLIPLSKTVYVVLTEGASPRAVVSICESVAGSVSGDFSIYVCCSRESGIGDVVREHFGENSPVRPIVIGNKTGMYVSAADVIFSAYTEADRKPPMPEGTFSRVYRSIGAAITAAKKFIAARRKAGGCAGKTVS